MVDYPALSGIDDASQVRLALVVNKEIAHVPLNTLMDVLGFQPLDAALTAYAAGVASAIPIKQDGRLTLTTAVPVTTADVTAAGTIYYTPYVGNTISLYSGTAWVNRSFTELSLALTATSGKPYDVFVYDNAGTAALETLVWTNDTTRATALVRQDGVLCKTGALTRRYVGTFYASASNQTEDSKAKRFVWNMYNRVRRSMSIVETTDSWTYTLATFRQARASTANQLDYVCGDASDAVEAQIIGACTNSVTSVAAAVAVGVDSTTTPAVGATIALAYAPANQAIMPASSYRGNPGVGRHTLVWLEYSTGTGTCTWYGDNAVVYILTGITGSVSA